MTIEEVSQSLLSDGQQIRRKWLLFTLFISFIYPIVVTCIKLALPSIALLNIQGLNPFYKDPSLFAKSDILRDYVSSMVSGSIFVSILYYFSYFKQGTKWLTYCLVATSINLLLFVGYFRFIEYSITILLQLIIEYILAIWWIAISWNLRIYNTKILLLRKFPEESMKVTSSLMQATNLDDLNFKFTNLVQNQPVLEPILSQAYRNKMLEFSNK